MFIKLCVVEVNKGNRPGTHFNKQGWDNLVKHFALATNRKYTRIQLKNRWDTLKKELSQWKTLTSGETGLCWNHECGTVDATPEWWSRKLQAHPETAKFRERGPILINDQELLFSDIVASGSSAWALSSSMMPPHTQDEAETNGPTAPIDLDDDQMAKDIAEHDSGMATYVGIDSDRTGGSRRSGNEIFTRIRKKTKKTTTAEKIAKCFERIVETVFASTSTSPNNRQFTIQECLESLEKIQGIKEGDALWMYATRLFLNPSIRELFLSIKRDEIRLQWLQAQMEMDNARKACSCPSQVASRSESDRNDNASSG
ncbi:hypothetical protein NMG60_11002819 [Bertholletia excelsa]